MAVEVGFEPTEVLPPHTLSRRARSATTRLHRGGAYRPARLSLPGEKVASSAPHSWLAYARDDLGPVVEPAVAHDVPERAGGAGLRVRRAVDDPVDPRQHRRAGAHRAGLERHDEGAAGQPPGAERSGAPPAAPTPRRGRSGPGQPRGRCGRRATTPPGRRRRPRRPARPRCPQGQPRLLEREAHPTLRTPRWTSSGAAQLVQHVEAAGALGQRRHHVARAARPPRRTAAPARRPGCRGQRAARGRRWAGRQGGRRSPRRRRPRRRRAGPGGHRRKACSARPEAAITRLSTGRSAGSRSVSTLDPQDAEPLVVLLDEDDGQVVRAWPRGHRAGRPGRRGSRHRRGRRRARSIWSRCGSGPRRCALRSPFRAARSPSR